MTIDEYVDNQKYRHLKKLEEDHAFLDKKILELHKQYANDYSVAVLKMKKLKLKNEIETLRKEL
jgi:hypothetical protein